MEEKKAKKSKYIFKFKIILERNDDKSENHKEEGFLYDFGTYGYDSNFSFFSHIN